jgi:hypothetical protein
VDRTQRLAASLHGMLGGFVHTAAALLSWPVPVLPLSVVDRWTSIERQTRALADIWRRSQDPVAVERLVRAIQVEVIALDRAVEHTRLPAQTTVQWAGRQPAIT